MVEHIYDKQNSISFFGNNLACLDPILLNT